MLNHEGGVIDDLIVYRTDELEYLLVVNASKIDEDREWILQHGFDQSNFSDRSAQFSALALQGPKALEIARVFLGAGWPEPKRNEITPYSWNCEVVYAARTGYTGEDGIEGSLDDPGFVECRDEHGNARRVREHRLLQLRHL